MLKPEDFFAVYNGCRWYLSGREGGIAMTREADGEFYASLVLPGKSGARSGGSIAGLGMLGSALGGAIVGAVVGALMANDVSAGNGSHTSLVLYKARLNGATKRFVPVQQMQ